MLEDEVFEAWTRTLENSSEKSNQSNLCFLPLIKKEKFPLIDPKAGTVRA